MKTETRRCVRKWMALNAEDYPNPTELAEAAADAFNIYSNANFDIPEWVFEDALIYKAVE